MNSLKRIRELVELASGTWYHGSPSGKLADGFSNFAGSIVFLTRDRNVAEHYARVPVLGAQRGPRDTPTVYTVDVSASKTFDFRNWAHRPLYEKIRANYNANVEDPDDALPSLKSQGFLQAKGVPGFGHVRAILPLVAEHKFDSMWVDEGAHGLSLAVWRGAVRITILNRQSV